MKVNVTDKTKLNSQISARSNSEGFGLANAFGLEKDERVTAAGISPDKLLTTS